MTHTFGPARQSVQRVADALVEEIAPFDDPRHRRARLVRVTPRARRASCTIQAAWHVWADAPGAEIGAADLQGADAMLDRVYRALEEPTA